MSNPVPNPARFCIKCGHELKDKEVLEHSRPVLRRACECGWVAYNNPVPVTMCLVERPAAGASAAEVLMVRPVEWPAQAFGFVAGFLESADASPAHGMARELLEEVGLNVPPERLTLVGVATLARMNQIVVVYHLLLPSGAPDVAPDAREIAEHKWVPLHKLKPGWLGGPADVIRAWLATRLAAAKARL